MHSVPSVALVQICNNGKCEVFHGGHVFDQDHAKGDHALSQFSHDRNTCSLTETLAERADFYPGKCVKKYDSDSI